MRYIFLLLLLFVPIASATSLTNCHTTFPSDTVCVGCGYGFTLSTDRRACVACPRNCEACRSKQDSSKRVVCIRCAPGFVSYTADGLCYPCPTNACTRCHYDFADQALRCDECLGTHALDSQGVCQKLSKGQYKDRIHGMARPCPLNALTCEDIGRQHAKISSCDENHGIKQDEVDPMKYECTRSGRGVMCAQGYMAVDRSMEDWCVPCPLDAGYYLDGPDCMPCPGSVGGTLKCWRLWDAVLQDEVWQVHCAAGYQAYQATPRGDSVCVECPESCETCRNELLTAKQLQCAECRRGHYMQREGKCRPCPGEECQACSTGDACDVCAPRYRRHERTHRCVPCPANCALCDDQQCLQCHTGFAAIGQEDYYCSPCTKNCRECDSFKCTECDDGWYVKEDGKCYRLSRSCLAANYEGKCTKCADGWYLDYGRCHKLIEYCRKGFVGKCHECFSGYRLLWVYWAGYKCLPNPEGCLHAYDRGRYCYQCRDGYGIFQHECLLCSQQCKTCSHTSYDISICQECVRGYGLTSETTCEPCQSNCLKCSFGEDKEEQCEECMDNYGLTSENTCEPCQSNCLKCSFGKNKVCHECMENYVYTGDGRCMKCPETCPGTCVVDALRNPVCSFNCAAGYVGEACEDACPAGCSDCEKVSCGDTSCMKCSSCSERFGRAQALSCAPCPPGCATCAFNSTLVTMQCKSCEVGYYHYRDDSCMACPQGCEQCLSATECTVCADGYSWSRKTSRCRKCSENCKLCHREEGEDPCSDGVVVCDECKTGYVAVGWDKCEPSPSNLDCWSGGGRGVQEPQRCQLDGCADGTHLTADFQCAITCIHSCPNTHDNGTRPSEGEVECPSGCCFIHGHYDQAGNKSIEQGCASLPCDPEISQKYNGTFFSVFRKKTCNTNYCNALPDNAGNQLTYSALSLALTIALTVALAALPSILCFCQ